METGKPLISILMAVYEPRMDWLKEQLESLEAQTYPNLKLYIRDDCSPTVPFDEIRSCVRECIHSFPYELKRNEKNLGSNGTFEFLTKEAEGKYFAYCDQDDVWLPEKLEILEKALKKGVAMSYCDMAVVDGRGERLADSLRQLRPKLRYMEGVGLSERYFFRNCTAGCSMLIRAETARRARPFPEGTVHDQWLAIIAAIDGEVAFVDRRCMNYRQYDGNQTGVLNGVADKRSYYQKRVFPLKKRLEAYSRYTRPSAEMVAFVEGRLKGKIGAIWHGKTLSPYDALAEIGMKLLPETAFKKCLEKSK